MENNINNNAGYSLDDVTDEQLAEAASDMRLADVDAGPLGSFTIFCENVDDALADARELLKLWKLKDSSLRSVHVMVYRPYRKKGLCADYIVFEDHSELYVEA